MPYAIRVKPRTKGVDVSGGCRWVVDGETGYYVSKKERGVFLTEEEAYSHVTEDWEEVVFVEASK